MRFFKAGFACMTRPLFRRRRAARLAAVTLAIFAVGAAFAFVLGVQHFDAPAALCSAPTLLAAWHAAAPTRRIAVSRSATARKASRLNQDDDADDEQDEDGLNGQWKGAGTPYLPQDLYEGEQVSFGKHRGKTFQQMVEEEPDYCAWILKVASSEDAGMKLREFAAWIQQNAPHVSPQSEGDTIRFGKYSGRQMEEIVAIDAPYCSWVLRQAEDPAGGMNLKQFATYLHTHHPELKPQASETVEFGKHKGKSWTEVLNEDEDYCRWILRASTAPDASRGVVQFAQFLRQKAPSLA